jgi:hypothetical protein
VRALNGGNPRRAALSFGSLERDLVTAPSRFITASDSSSLGTRSLRPRPAASARARDSRSRRDVETAVADVIERDHALGDVHGFSSGSSSII